MCVGVTVNVIVSLHPCAIPNKCVVGGLYLTGTLVHPGRYDDIDLGDHNSNHCDHHHHHHSHYYYHYNDTHKRTHSLTHSLTHLLACAQTAAH